MLHDLTWMCPPSHCFEDTNSPTCTCGAGPHLVLKCHDIRFIGSFSAAGDQVHMTCILALYPEGGSCSLNRVFLFAGWPLRSRTSHTTLGSIVNPLICPPFCTYLHPSHLSAPFYSYLLLPAVIRSSKQWETGHCLVLIFFQARQQPLGRQSQWVTSLLNSSRLDRTLNCAWLKPTPR